MLASTVIRKWTREKKLSLKLGELVTKYILRYLHYEYDLRFSLIRDPRLIPKYCKSLEEQPMILNVFFHQLL